MINQEMLTTVYPVLFSMGMDISFIIYLLMLPNWSIQVTQIAVFLVLSKTAVFQILE